MTAKKRVQIETAVGECLFLALLFPLAWWLGVVFPFIVAVIINGAGKLAYTAHPLHLKRKYCWTLTATIYLSIGILSAGLAVAVPLLFARQPMLVVILIVGVTLAAAHAGDLQHRLRTAEATTDSLRTGVRWAVGHMKALRNLPRPFVPEMATEEEIRAICGKLKMKRLDTNIIIDSWVDNMSIKEIQHKYDDFKHVEYDAVRVRITRAKNKVREFMAQPP